MMSRIVLCSPPLRGHVIPIAHIGRRLVAHGHEAAMVTGSRFRNVVEGAGMTHVPLAGAADFDETDPLSFTPDIERLTGMALSRHQVTGTFVEPIPEQAHALDAALRLIESADVVLADATFAGVVPLLNRPAENRPRMVGLGTLPLAQRSVDVPPYNSGMPVRHGSLARARNRAAHVLAHRVLFRSVQHRAERLVSSVGGTLPFPILDLSRAFDAFVQLSPREFEYPRRDISANVVFAGPILPGATTARPDDADAARVESNRVESNRPVVSDHRQPSWWRGLDSSRPIVHLTQGTLDNHDFTQLVIPAMTALASMPVSVVVSTGGAPLDRVGASAPDNTIVVEHVDYRWLLPRTSLLITNGGYGTVQQALANRVPVIVAPGGEDKPEVAARVDYFGVGMDLKTRRPTPAQIGTAVDSVVNSTAIARRVDQLATRTATYDPIAIIADAAHLPIRPPTTTPGARP